MRPLRKRLFKSGKFHLLPKRYGPNVCWLWWTKEPV